tara:strand:- start:1123 stop:1356 length:234 start_codon:yes stop_codon:yes gene_type:complete
MIFTRELVIVNVNYWMPDYTSILQEFIWQTEDLVPEIPRVHKFLNFWHENIDAVISEVQVSTATQRDLRIADFIKEV